MARRNLLGVSVLDLDVDDSKLHAGLKKGEGEASGFTSRLRKSFGQLRSDIGSSLGLGVGLGVGAAAFGAVTGAIRGTISGLTDMVVAAREETTSVAQLTASLKANSTAFDGNTDAIERVIEERMALGFADDEQREALAGLTAITKDHNKALDLQRTAMDLARLRNIDLRTASDLLGKVYGGNLGILSRYGIVLEKGSSATQALAKIQAMAAGQAESWAQTEEGAAQTSGIALSELGEDIGAELLPMFTELAKFTRDVVVPSLRFVVDVAREIVEGIGQIVDAVGGFVDEAGNAFDTLGMDFGDMGDRLHQIADDTETDFTDVKERVAQLMAEMGMSFTEAADTAERELKRMAAGATPAQLAYERMQADVSWAMRESGQVVADEAAGMNTALTTETEEGTANAVEEMRKLPGEMADALREGRKAWQDEVEQLGNDLENETTRDQRIATLLGELTGESMRKGLASKDDVIHNQAVHARNLILAQLRIEAGPFAIRLVDSWVQAMNANAHRMRDAARSAAGGVGGVFPKSEPKDPQSPFRGVTHWGGDIVRMIAGDMMANLGVGEAAGRALAGVLAPVLPSMAVARGLNGPLELAAGATTVGGTTINNINLLDRMEIRTPRDIGAGLDILGERGYLGRRSNG